MNTNDEQLPRLNDKEKIAYITGLAIIKSEITALKSLLTLEQKQRFDEIIRLHRNNFANSQKGLTREESSARAVDFNEALFFKIESER